MENPFPCDYHSRKQTCIFVCQHWTGAPKFLLKSELPNGELIHVERIRTTAARSNAYRQEFQKWWLEESIEHFLTKRRPTQELQTLHLYGNNYCVAHAAIGRSIRAFFSVHCAASTHVWHLGKKIRMGLRQRTLSQNSCGLWYLRSGRRLDRTIVCHKKWKPV